MKWYKDRKISTKLIMGFILVAILAGIVGAVSIVNLKSIGEADTRLYEVNTLGTNYAGTANIYFQRIRFNTVKALITTGTNQQGECLNDITNYTAQVDKSIKDYESGDISAANRKCIDALKPQWEAYKKMMNDVTGDIKSGNNDAAQNLILGGLADTGDKVQKAFDDVMDYNADSGKSKNEENEKLIKSATVIMLTVILVAVIAAVLLGIGISRIISRPVKEMVDAANKLALGDVNAVIDVDTQDEIGTLAKAFEELIASTREQALVAKRISEGDLTSKVAIRSENDLMGKSIAELLDKLNQIVGTIVQTSEQVASGSNMVSNSSVALSQGATEQASSVEELTASIEEISSQITKNAENAGTARDLAKNAESRAAEGNTQMKDMLTAMAEINESSGNINKIIKVIDDIAFQTNILALNAAVEAARAGQNGKGFAVVAEEVRSLAAKSANAVKETTVLIENSIKKVEAGTEIADNTAEALNEIVDKIRDTAQVINEIATASDEQAIGAEQISQGIAQISQVVQTNAATSEESAAASEELSSQAAQLKDIVSIFKLKQDASAASSMAALPEEQKVPVLTA